METLGIFLLWAVAGAVVMAVAFARTGKRDAEPTSRAPFPKVGRVFIGLAAIAVVVAIPAVVIASAPDRIPSGAGTYTVDSTPAQRAGRLIFRQTCASCHNLDAAGARGVYGPNLDTLGGLSDARVLSAIEQGRANLMPAGLLTGVDAELVAAYVAKVAGGGRN